MKQLLTVFLLISCLQLWSQETSTSNFVFTPEFLLGTSAEANEDFPDRDLQTQLQLNFGWRHNANPQEWAHRLKAPTTGISLGYTDLGNPNELGAGITLLSFIEFNAFRMERLKVKVGMGGTYFTEKYDPITNPNNQAITTDVTWSFRTFIHYKLFSTQNIDWRLGVGYFHHSNGHTRLPNQGLNSFLVSLAADINQREQPENSTATFEDTRYKVLTARFGYGINALSIPDPFNDKLPVYTFAAQYGKVYNKTWKLSVGMYYRFYQHYYDYIKNNESLVQDGREFEDFKDNPWFNASVFGISGGAEVLLNHVGIDLEIGVNISKPAYKIDWRINEGWDNTPREIPEDWQLGEFTTKFRVKHILATRMGLKYYLFGTKDVPAHNVYLGFHINANGGQADFTDLSLGYVYSFDLQSKK